MGPSLSADTVQKIVPDAYVLPPVRRGDLYRDRMLGFSSFLILDGVFFNELAIAPREIIDVLDDGGYVMGASSMGAIRAAECWPAGMHGVGSIYRLYRRGGLKSDDEVALVFNEEMPDLVLSVPLINVRYALSRAIRDEVLDRRSATRIESVAFELFYADRIWPRILKDAGIFDEDVHQYLKSHDLKALDAERACKRLASLIEKDRQRFLSPRQNVELLPQVSVLRESPAQTISDAVDEQEKRDFSAWLAVSGRFRRYSASLDVEPARGETKEQLTRDALLANRKDISEALWQRLEAANELEALLWQHRALREAVVIGRELDRRPGETYYENAATEIAEDHGYETWELLRVEAAPNPEFYSRLDALVEDLALAKFMRHERN